MSGLSSDLQKKKHFFSIIQPAANYSCYRFRYQNYSAYCKTLIFGGNLTIIIDIFWADITRTVADPEGVQGVRSNPPPSVFKYPIKMK